MFASVIGFVADQSKWDATIHEGEMAVRLALTVIHLVPGYGN